MPSTHVSASYDTSKSEGYFEKVRKIIPTGVNSVGRLRSQPLAFTSARGSHLEDIDGNDYVDLVLGLGPVLVGHNEPLVREALKQQIDNALILGGETPLTLELADRLRHWIPCADHIVFTNTGSEAVQVALRVARAKTGRRKVVKFEGHFHGWLDPMYTSIAGVAPSESDNSELSPVHAGPGQVSSDSLLVGRWNDFEQLCSIVRAHPSEIAAVIMEPIPMNFGAYLPDLEYLQKVRELCSNEGIVLIFDEVVSGFRVDKSGAQGLLGVVPDIATFAKALGGGIPVAMVAGSSSAMEPLVSGRLGHAGTYNANPLSIAGADATTRLIDSLPDLYSRLETTGARLAASLSAAATDLGVPLTVNRVGSVLQLLWNVHGDARSYASCSTSDRASIARVCEAMAHHGVYTHPRGLMFVSYRHTEQDVDQVASAFTNAVIDSGLR